MLMGGGRGVAVRRGDEKPPGERACGVAAGADFRAALYGRYVSGFKAEAKLDGHVSFAWWDHKYLPLLDDLERSAPVLEIGCGAGGLLAYLGRRGFSHAMGIDISAEQIELAQKRGIWAEEADAFDFLGSAQRGFAAILAVDVFEHFSRNELLRLAPLLYAA